MDELNNNLHQLTKRKRDIRNDIKNLEFEFTARNESNQMKYTLTKQLHRLKQKKLKKEDELESIRNLIDKLKDRISKINEEEVIPSFL